MKAAEVYVELAFFCFNEEDVVKSIEYITNYIMVENDMLKYETSDT